MHVPNAADTVARTARLWMQPAVENDVLFQVDMRNAFGLLAEVKARCPVLYPYATACGDGYMINSTRGVQQEDVCGPAPFASALHTIVLRLQELHLELTVWYLDDGILCGSISSVKKALALLKQYLPNAGLELNLAKCKLLGLGTLIEEPAFEEISRVPANEGTIVLGVPVANDSFVHQAVCAKVYTLLTKVTLLKSNLAKFLLLRACFGAFRVNHLCVICRSLMERVWQSNHSFCSKKPWEFSVRCRQFVST